ncbi:MAG: ArsB/NhaD family transporter, partial [Planctomycetota bacterium]
AIAFEKQIGVHKTISAMFGSSLMLFFVLQPPRHENAGMFANTYSFYVDFNVIFLLAGMMMIVNLLRETGAFQYLAIKCAKVGRGRPLPVLALLLFTTALLSAFLDNVTTVLLIAPVTLLVAQQLKLDPVSFLIPEALASNIGGTATLIGDPPNILIGSFAKLDFLAFLHALTPFILLVMAFFVGVLAVLLRGKMRVTSEERAQIMDLNERRVITDATLLKKSLVVMAFTLAGFLLHGFFHIEPGVVAMGGAALLLLVTRANVARALEEVEWPTLFFFLGLFIVVSGAVQVGLISAITEKVFALTAGSPARAAVLVLWVSGLCAGLMNNISFVAAALPVVGSLASGLHLDGARAEPLWWALALGACLGGNLTPVGAAANLVICDISGKNGYPISFGRFFRWGLPCALGSLLLSTFYILFLVHRAG